LKNQNSNYDLLRNFPWRFFKKIGLLQLSVIVLTVLIGSAISRLYLKDYIIEESKVHLQESVHILEHLFKTSTINPIDWCQSLEKKSGARYTLIDPEGVVLCDNYAVPEEMTNHLDRPEIRFLIGENKSELSVRYSDTTKEETLYYAIKLSLNDKTIFLRKAVPLTKLKNAMRFMDSALLFILLPVIVISFLLLFWGSIKVSRPLQTLLLKVKHLEKELDDVYKGSIQDEDDEWLVLENTLDKAANKISTFLSLLKNEHQKTQLILQTMPTPLIALDRESKILFTNKAFADAFKLEGIETASGKKIWEFIRDIDLQNFFVKVINREKDKIVKNYQIENRLGEKVTYDGVISPLRDEKNVCYGALGIFLDITSRYQNDKLRADFVGNISHEIKTPLTAILGYAQVLEDELVKLNKVELNDYLQKIQRNAKRLSDLFQDVLSLSKIENSKKLDKTFIATKELTDYVVSNIEQSYKHKNLKLEKEFHEDQVFSEEGNLEQILSNIIENAYKYTPAQGVIRIVWDRQKSMSRLMVENSGETIPEIHHSRLFERFYRVDESRSREQGGSGLGLSIVKHIAQNHGGSVGYSYNVENKLHQFFVLFPLT
jgi:two-component system, OmpR family, phosphate regulon sensor histidine kinase PhoR